MQIWSLSHRYSCRYIVYDAGFEEQCPNFQLYLKRIAHESFYRPPQYMVKCKIWIRKWWSRHANHGSIASFFKRIYLHDAGFKEQCQTFNYTSPESPTNHFSVNLYKWSRPNLNKKMVVTSCKYGPYRIGNHADILNTTKVLKNIVRLSIIPHPNRPRIIFSVNLYMARPNLNKKMVVTSCKYGPYRICVHADIL